MLQKPRFAPPAHIFGYVWTPLYILIAISFGFVFYKIGVQAFPRGLIAPFLLNLVFNFMFVPIQFRMKSNVLALIDILLVVGTLLWAMIIIYPYVPWVTYLNIPYLAWVAFATVLQVSIVYLNRN